MDFRQFQYILKVAEEKSFSRAAQKLYIAQPSLSQYISKQEHELGVQLFDRSTIPLRLTYAGELYIKTALQILDLKQQLLQQMEDISHFKKGKLVIGLSSFRSTYLMPQVLPTFNEKFPGIEIVLMEGTSGELEDLALKGITDLSIVPLPVKQEYFEYEAIIEEEVLLAVPPRHPLSLKHYPKNSIHPLSINLSLFKESPFILLKGEQKLHQIGLSLCHQSGFKPHIALESKSVEAANALCGAGIGVTFVPDTLVRFAQVPQLPCYFSMENLNTYRTLAATYRKGRYLSKSAQEFIILLKDKLLIE